MSWCFIKRLAILKKNDILKAKVFISEVDMALDEKNTNEFIYQEIKVEDIDEGPIINPFDPTLIDIDTKQPTISNIVDQIRNNEIDLSPDFQRAANLWSKEKQSRLIESILLRIPLPAFYFDVESTKDSLGCPVNRWHVIDGLQRLSAIRNFISPDSSDNHLRLKGLEFLKLDNKSFEELPGPYQRLIQQTQLIVYLIKPGTPENVKFNIFKRVNTGGLPLTQQEIRHALNQGVPAKYLRELAESEHFTIATREKIDQSRMLDREFVNRFLAFYLLDRQVDVDLDTFLNNALQKLEKMSEKERDDVKYIFYDTLDTVFSCFNKYAFCKLDAFEKLKPINKVLFEVLTVSVAKLSYQERKILRNKDCLLRYVDLFNAEKGGKLTELVSFSTSDKNRVNQRYEIVEKFLQEVIYA